MKESLDDRLPSHSSPLIALPTELKSRIAQFLPVQGAINLACTCSALVDIGERVSWSAIHLSSLDLHEAAQPSNGADYAAIGACVAALWTLFEERLRTQPARRAHVTRLNYPVSPAAVPLMARTLPCLVSLRVLEERNSYPPGDPPLSLPRPEYATVGNAGLVAIQQCRCLPSVREFEIEKAAGSIVVLFRALSCLPNLRLLAAETYFTTEHDDEAAPGASAPRLPYLEQLDIAPASDQMPEILGPIIHNAPRLRNLAIWSEFYPDIKRSTSLDDIFGSRSVRYLFLGKNLFHLVLRPRVIPETWLPHLEILEIDDNVSCHAAGNRTSI